ncbi:MAG: peptidylprolyl isomerase [Gammaproteobacteria bacterium]|nr:peptidylprolyl isomerase [Gammaproteobacteria bacterium]MBQ0841028.1 peptidylprolyl isomerase [Gammaproteobacteria bacterium]
MKISKDSVVEFEYSLKDGAGKELENSDGGEATVYLHGHGAMLPALEQELAGREVGDHLAVDLTQPYGPTHPDSVQRVPLKHLRAKKRPEPGTIVVVQGKEGPRQVTVVKVGKFSVDVDTNHPFAGLDLTFDITIKTVREATKEELSHGHSHGADGSHSH